MKLDPRTLLGVGVAGVGVWLGIGLFAPEEKAPIPPGRPQSSQECQDCHQQVFEEWASSQHAMAWINPFVRELSDDFSNKDCIDCHAPRPVWETGIGERVLFRETHRAEGVDCLACHLLPEGDEGGVAGTITNAGAQCRHVAKLDLQRPVFCAGCHEQHQTVSQWEASSWKERGIDCLDCHMPHRNGDPNQGRDHTCLGGNDLGMLQSAVELRARREGGAVTVEVENVGAGHSFPTDERSRASDVFWRPVGEARWRHLYRFRSPYRDEVGVPDTLLQADATWTGTIDDADAAGAIEVAIFYKRSPYFTDPDNPDPDNEATLVHRLELEP